MPNIVFILSDDQGAWAMHCAGTPELYTPNLDRLAREGALFSDFYCASPVCSPARASILTGRMPSAHGVHDWIRSGNLDARIAQIGISKLCEHVFHRLEKRAYAELESLPQNLERLFVARGSHVKR